MDASSFVILLKWSAGIAISFLVIKLVLTLTRYAAYVKMVDAVPGPPALPIIGNAWDYWVPHEDIFLAFLKSTKNYSNFGVLRFWLGPLDGRFLIQSAKGAEVIFNSQLHIAKADIYSFFQPWLGLGLLTSTGEKWRTRRKMLTPSFHFQILDQFINVFNEQSQILVGILKRKEGKGQFDIFPYITHCALDIICESAMGTNHNAQNNAESDYVKAVYGMGTIFTLRVIRPWLGNEFLFKLSPQRRQEKKYLNILHSFTDEVIKERRQFHQQQKGVTHKPEEVFGKKRRLAFLDLLLEAKIDGKGLSDADIREEVDTFMFEGHDTTTAAIGFALFLLGWHPEIQKKVQQELDSLFGDSGRPITAADLSKLKYLEAVIKESLRLYPSVPMIARKLETDTLIGGHVLPGGSSVYICPYLIHRDPEMFSDPLKFDPGRFLVDKVANRHPFAYVPFSAGPRNCIGQKFAMMEEKIVLSDILRHFSVTSHEKPDNLKLLIEPVLRPAHGLKVSLEKR